VPFIVDGTPSGLLVVAHDRDLLSADTDAAALAAAASDSRC
jgi:hypothetical protein